MKKEILVIILIFSLIASLAIYFYSPVTPLKTGAVTSISKIEEGSISNGKMIGGKLYISAVVSNDNFVIRTKNQELKAGDYIIKPQKNLRIQIINKGAYAETTVHSLSAPYYKNIFGTVSYLNYVTNDDQWNIYTPFQIKIFADNTDNPNTLIFNKDYLLLQQDEESVSSDQKITVRQTQLSLLGPNLPSASIAAITSPVIESPPSDYRSGITYVFSKDSLINTLNNFYTEFGYGGIVYGLNNPLLFLWYGSDTYKTLSTNLCGGPSGFLIQTNGFCKSSTWKGLPNQVSSPNLNIKFDNNKFTMYNVSYTSSITLILDTEIVDSLLVLKGIGQVSNAKMEVSKYFQEGNLYKASITFTNSEDEDEFIITPKALNSHLTFDPVVSSLSLGAGETKTISFDIKVSGIEYNSEQSLSDHISFKIKPIHNDNFVTLETDVLVGYNAKQRGQPVVSPTSGSTKPTPSQNKLNSSQWFENPWLYIGILIILISSLYYYTQIRK